LRQTVGPHGRSRFEIVFVHEVLWRRENRGCLEKKIAFVHEVLWRRDNPLSARKRRSPSCTKYFGGARTPRALFRVGGGQSARESGDRVRAQRREAVTADSKCERTAHEPRVLRGALLDRERPLFF
jgi:hypothetical protein